MLDGVRGPISERSRRVAVLALTGAAACLDPNPDFDGAASSTGMPGESSGTSSSAGDSTDGAESAETSVTCEPDGFEPNDDEEAPILTGSFSVNLHTVDDRDRFNFFVENVGSGEFWIAADADVRACVYLQCEGTSDPPVIDCQDPATSGSSEEGQIGCCGGPAAGLLYTCAAEMGVKFHLLVDQAPADCTEYELEIATSLP